MLRRPPSPESGSDAFQPLGIRAPIRAGTLPARAPGRPGGATRSGRLQRFFSTFPAGWPAAGLLLLRAVAGGAAVGQGGSYLLQRGEPTLAAMALGAFAIVSGLALVAGVLTPASAAAVGVSMIVMAATWPASATGTLVIDRPAAGLVIAVSLALAMLGPGAHSIDALLFGRREIVIPESARRRAEP